MMVVAYANAASVLTLADLPDEPVRKLGRYPQLPVTVLDRLDVDHSSTGKRVGEHLLLDATHRSLAYPDQSAEMAVVVDTNSASAARFYEQFGFMSLQTQPHKQFAPMGEVAQFLGR